MNDEGSSKNVKTEGSYYNGHYVEQNSSKRAPRMSEQPEMKTSDILKVPTFLQEKQ